MKVQKERKRKEDELKEIRIENLQQKLIQKGYEDGNLIKDINYSQVETSSPKYSIIGRHFIKNEYDHDIVNKNNNNNYNLIIGAQSDNENNEINNYNLPDFNVVKTSYPAFSFSQDKRFKDIKVESNEKIFNDIFVNGNYGEETRKDFSKKEPYSLKDKRGIKQYIQDFPGPGEYKIKNCFDEIVEKGLKINQNRQKKLNENKE